MKEKLTRMMRNPQYSKKLIQEIEQLKKTAAKDELTGLLNRGTVERYIRSALDEMQEGEVCAMFIIDLDNFKTVNDTLGHQTGDRVLAQAARILAGMFRASDIVGRLGGDEFVAFLRGNLREELIREKGHAICEHMQMTLRDAQEVTVTASVGICMSNRPDIAFETLYRLTDEAMYQSKKEGRRRYHLIRDDGGRIFSAKMMHPAVAPVKLHQILSHIDDGVALMKTEPPFEVIYANPGFCRLSGAAGEVQSGKQLVGLICEEDADMVRKIMDDIRVLRGNDYTVHDVRINGPDGEYLWCQVRMALVDYDENSSAILISASDISELKKKERLLEQANNRLQIAFNQTGQGLWEVDLASGNMHIYQEWSGDQSAKETYEFPEGLIEKEWVHPESVDAFRDFARDLYAGSPKGYGIFVLKYKKKKGYNWAALSYNMMYDNTGEPLRAVGIIESMNMDVQEIRPSKNRLSRRYVPDSLMSHMILRIYADLTTDEVKEVWNEGKNVTDEDGWKSYTDVIRRAERKMFASDERERFIRTFYPEMLMEEWEKGNRWFRMEYRRMSVNGQIQWVTYVSGLHADPDKKRVMLFGFLYETNERHLWETTLGAEIKKDPVTSLYTKNTVRVMARAYLNREIEERRQRSSLQLSAVVMIHVQGIEKLYAADIERKRRYIVNALATALGSHQITGQYDRDRIVAFFPRVASKDRLRSRIEQAYTYVRETLSDMLSTESLCFVAGVVTELTDEAKYEEMEHQALDFSRLWEQGIDDRVVFDEDVKDITLDEVRKKTREDHVHVFEESYTRPLTELEKDVLIQGLSDMLMAESLGDAMRHLFNRLGKFYDADRVYILTLAKETGAVAMPSEWVAPGRQSIQIAISGIKMDQLPLLEQCVREQRSLFFTRDRMIQSKREEWRFMIIPLVLQGEASAFLCIENARQYFNDNALPRVLVPYILRERERYHNTRSRTVRTVPGSREKLPNLRTYTETICQFHSGVYDTLGAVCLEIPGMVETNGGFGTEYGRQMLQFVTETLAASFDKNMLFRTWNSECVALCPNTTRAVFLSRCKRIRSAIQSRYPGRVRIGQKWSDGSFDGKTLVDEARAIMRCEGTALHSQAGEKPKRICDTMEEAIQTGRFTVFIQPKIHIPTGKMCGGEVLVRGLGDDGVIIPPSEFLDKLEENGKIRDLDFYVLDRAMCLVEEWKAEGRKVPPLSVNFSEQTLLDPLAVAEVLSIASRYPSASKLGIEIEVAERADKDGYEARRKQIDLFREYGIRFQLDDFGALDSDLSVIVDGGFDIVKLDRALTADLAGNQAKELFVREILSICGEHGIRCIAEGVETGDQLEALVRAGCEYAQGYYFEQPLSIDHFREKYLYLRQDEEEPERDR